MISGVILAAGSSTRMGRPKQLADLGGKPLLQHVVDLAESSALDEIILVLGHRAEEVATAVRLPSRGRVTINPDHELGQSTSLRAGLRAASDESRAAVILLGDQPSVRADAVAAVIQAYGDGQLPVVQACYAGRPAHPTLIDRSLWPEVDALTGDEGARALIAGHPERRILVEIGGTPPQDIDTEEDLARARMALAGR